MCIKIILGTINPRIRELPVSFLWDRVFLDTGLGAEKLSEDQDDRNRKWAGNELVRNMRRSTKEKAAEAFTSAAYLFLVSKGGLFVFAAVNSLKSWVKTQSFCPLYGHFVTHMPHLCQENSCVIIQLQNYPQTQTSTWVQMNSSAIQKPHEMDPLPT